MAEHRDDYTISPEEMRQWRAAIRGVMRDAGRQPRPEALRQLASLIQLYALRTGANITPDDSTMVARMLAGLTPGELEALASSPQAVMGKVAQIVTHFADMDVKLQEKAKEAGDPRGADQGPADGQDRMPRILREPHDKFPARRASNEGKSASYSDLPGASASGSFDISKVSAAKFYSDPSFSMFRNAGMGLEQTQQLYRDLNRQGFKDREIYRAANDVGDLRIGENPEAMRRNTERASRLNRHSPGFLPAFKGIDGEQGKAYVDAAIKAGKLQRQLDEARAKGDRAAAEKLEKDLAEATKKTEELRQDTLKREDAAIGHHVKPQDTQDAKGIQEDTWRRREKEIHDGVAQELRANPNQARANSTAAEHDITQASKNQVRAKRERIVAEGGANSALEAHMKKHARLASSDAAASPATPSQPGTASPAQAQPASAATGHTKAASASTQPLPPAVQP